MKAEKNGNTAAKAAVFPFFSAFRLFGHGRGPPHFASHIVRILGSPKFHYILSVLLSVIFILYLFYMSPSDYFTVSRFQSTRSASVIGFVISSLLFLISF